jgi:hypothetical protein
MGQFLLITGQQLRIEPSGEKRISFHILTKKDGAGGMEQRDNWICDAHEEAFRTIHKKLDDIVNRQIAYAETSTRIEMKQEQLEKIVTNGLTQNVAEMTKKINDIYVKISALEDFKWFRQPITKFRDKLFWYGLAIALLGGGIYSLVHYGSTIVKEVLP